MLFFITYQGLDFIMFASSYETLGKILKYALFVLYIKDLIYSNWYFMFYKIYFSSLN